MGKRLRTTVVRRRRRRICSNTFLLRKMSLGGLICSFFFLFPPKGEKSPTDIHRRRHFAISLNLFLIVPGRIYGMFPPEPRGRKEEEEAAGSRNEGFVCIRRRRRRRGKRRRLHMKHADMSPPVAYVRCQFLSFCWHV